MNEALTSFVWMFWTQLCEMAPYLLLGFLVAGLLSIFLSPALVERHLGRGRFWPVIKATLLGLPMPLCSCGVIPVAASLRRHRAGRGPTVAFLISTPQTGVDNILVVYSLLGLVFAIFSPIVALVSGIAGGLLISFTEKRVPQDEPPAEEVCREACCQPTPRGGRLIQALEYGFGTLARDIARPLLMGLVIAALISVAVPREWVQASLGGSLGLIVAMAVSLPVYVCATASVPIAAAMIASGASPGAAMVFLMTGPATNAATIMTVWKLMGPRAAGLYLFSTAGTALAAGATLNWLYAQPGVPDFVNIQHGAPGVFQTIAAAALLAVLLRALVRGKTGPAEPQAMAAVAAEGEGLLLKVAGMTCDHCAQSVSAALLRCPGVATVAVDRPSGSVHVRGAKLNREELAAAVTEAGFSLEGIEEHAGAADQSKGDHHD
ncbi:MAG: SO_0444 family Cu/Zn efflux transporter [Planctomycetaceae bacterium]|nr:SO_0444 family Cu/Zn efflux transporter [Planctomycetaceae bacterium]